MSSILYLILHFYLPAYLLVGLAAYLIYRRNRNGFIRINQDPPTRIYLINRNYILHKYGTEIQLPDSAKPDEPFAVMMESGTEQGTLLVVASADGNAGFFQSDGGFGLGGPKVDDTIRNAALRAVMIAMQARNSFAPVQETPFPETGDFLFYAVSRQGISMARSGQKEAHDAAHPLFPLARTMHEILFAYARLRKARQSWFSRNLETARAKLRKQLRHL